MKRVAVVAALVLVLAMMLMMLTMRVDANMLRHHRHRVVSDDDATSSSNVNKPNPIDSDVTTADCHLRHFVLTAVGVIQPDSATTSWVQAAHTALQIDELCPTTEPVKTTLSPPRPVAEPIPISPDSCDISYYVATDGSDSNAGTLASPFATLAHAIASTRSVRALTSLSSPCIFLRAGTYYLGESLPATAGSPKDSQFGAIDLISFDSGLTIAAYQGETVVLSGGARLTPSWQVYAQTATGTIYSTKLTPTNPSTQLLTDSFHLNELFVGGERAVRAKWPNGDPSTHGLFSSDTGYDSSAMNWLPPFPYNASVEVHGSSPSVFDDYFPNYQMGIGGPAHVYDPPRSFWATANPPGGGGATFIVPSGMNATGTDLAARAAKWSNPSTGYAHVFHGGAWANWIFSLGSYDANSSLLHFTEGGFQDARGWSTGGAFYVEWLIEELDDGFEWFFDESSQTLYFMPNGTGTAPPTELIVSQLPCILSAHGSADAPISNVVLSGLTFSHTSNTMMRKFEVPSGGDWSLHRGGAVFLTGTAYSTIQNSIFSYLGGTGVVISDWNLGTEVTTSEFVWGCDSGVVVLGTVSGIDGVTNTNQPTLVRVTNSLFHELGIYIKQSAPVLVSLSRSITVSGNAMFNVPRAGINVNDPFYGNHTLMGNVIFNTVRETADHGPINTWDRLPLMTLQLNETTGEWVPTIDPHVSYITRNLLFNAYHSAWPIDHDDGSRRYDDSRNVLVYGGFKNFLGNSKRVHNMVYIYPDFPRLTTTSSSSWLSSVHAQRITRTSPPELAQLRAPLGWGGQCVQAYSPLQNVAGWNEHWYENTCALWATSQPYELDSCQIGNLYNMIPFLANNTLYFPEGVTAQIPCALANGTAVMLTLADMQALGYDLGTTQSTVPPTTALVQLALETLFAV